MIKFNLMNFIDVERGQSLFNTFKDMTGITLAFAIQRTLQEEADYANNFCKSCVRKTPKGDSLCKKAFLDFAKAISKSKDNEPIIFECHAGLADIVAPVRVNGEVATFIVMGQILLHKHNIKKARAYARELGADEDKYVEEYKKIKYVTKDELKQLLSFQKTLVTFISNVATEYYKIYQRANRDILTISLLEGISGSFNLSDTLAIASKELCNLFDVSSAKVFEFNKVKKTFSTLATYKQNKSAPDLTLKYSNKTYLSSIMNFWCENIEEEASDRQVEFYDMTKKSPKLPKKLRDFYTNAGIYSVTGMKLKSTEDTYVILALLDSKTGRTWNKEDTNFLKLIGKNISLAVKQNNMTENLLFEMKSARAIFNSFDFPIYFKDTQSRFVNLNDSFCAYFGNTAQETFIGKTIEEVLGNEDYKVITDAEKFVMSSKQTITLERIKDVAKNKVFDVKMFPVCDEDKNMLGVFVHILNIENFKSTDESTIEIKREKTVKTTKPKAEKTTQAAKASKPAKTVKTEKETNVAKTKYTAKKSSRIYRKS